MKKSIGSKRAAVGLCVVLVAVSAFFYAPMDVKANSIVESVHIVSPFQNGAENQNVSAIRSFNKPIAIDSLSNLSVGKYYIVNYSGNSKIAVNKACAASTFNLSLNFDDFSLSLVNSDTYHGQGYVYNFHGSFVYHYLGSDTFTYDFSSYLGNFAESGAFKADFEFYFNVLSIEEINTYDANEFEEGYNAGYSAGEQAGEDIGYSNGYEVGFEQGENQGYESGFEAGKESVDTDSYYDMGYSSGYDAGYLSGYEEGYDEGYSTALKSVQGSSFEQKPSIILDYLGGVECLGNPFYVSSYGLIDMEEYQIGANGYFYNTVPGTYNGITNVSYNIPLWTLNNNSYPKFEGDKLRVRFTLMGLLASLDVNSGSAVLDANLMSSKIREVYVTYKGNKYYGNYSTSTSYADFDFIIDDFVGSGPHTLVDDMTLTFVVENSVTIVTNSDVTHYISAKYTPKVKFDLGRSNTGNSISLIPYVTNDRVSANIQSQTNEITGALEQQKEVQENQLEEQKEQTETQKGIAQSIKDFFGSFFDNLINSIIHVIVPTKEEMGELFNRLNDFFSETFGFLYYPFEFIINAFNIFLAADSGTGLTLPAFSIMGYEVWGSQTYDIASEPIVGEIFGFVRMGTGAMLVMWFVDFLKDFFDKRFGGGGS